MLVASITEHLFSIILQYMQQSAATDTDHIHIIGKRYKQYSIRCVKQYALYI